MLWELKFLSATSGSRAEPTTAKTKRSSRERTTRVLSNVKSMGNGFGAEKDETERETLSAVSSSSASRKRSLDV